MQWCSVFHSAIKQESAEVSEEIRAPWSHLAAVPVSFFSLSRAQGENSEEVKMYTWSFLCSLAMRKSSSLSTCFSPLVW